MILNGSYSGCTYNMGLSTLGKLLPAAAIETYADRFYPGGNAQYQIDKDKPGASSFGIPFRYATEDVFGFCLPKIDTEQLGAFGEKAIDELKAMFNELIMNDKVSAYIADVAYSWRVIAICSVTAIVLGYLYLFVVRLIGAIIVWGSIIAIQLGLIAAAVYVYF